MNARARTVVSWFQHDARRVGSLEQFARELSCQLAGMGWRSVLCFEQLPPEPVRAWLEAGPARLVAHGPMTNRAAAWKVFSRVLTEEQPLVLHTHFLGPLDRAHWYGWLHRVPAILNTDHGSKPAGWIARPAPFLKRQLGRFLSAPLDRLVTVSEFNKRCSVTLGYVAPHKICCIHNGISLENLQVDPEAGAHFRSVYGLRPDALVVMQVSHMIAEKGIRDLLDAARLWRTACPQAQLCLVGDGRQRREFEQEASASGLQDTVVFTGQVPDLRAAYSAADVVTQVSRWQEAFGAVIVEAMSCERPVIAARVGGIPEIVDPGESGLLVDPGRPDQIADAVIQMAGNPALRERMGKKGRAQVGQRFSLPANVHKLITLYGELIPHSRFE